MKEVRRWTIPSVGKNVEKLELSHITSGNVIWLSHFGNRLAIPQKGKHWVSYEAAIIIQGLYHQRNENISLLKNSFQMFIAAWFIIAPKQNNSNVCPSTNG